MLVQMGKLQRVQLLWRTGLSRLVHNASVRAAGRRGLCVTLRLIGAACLRNAERRIDFLGPVQPGARQAGGHLLPSSTDGIMQPAYPKGYASALQAQIYADPGEHALGASEPQAHNNRTLQPTLE